MCESFDCPLPHPTTGSEWQHRQAQQEMIKAESAAVECYHRRGKTSQANIYSVLHSSTHVEKINMCSQKKVRLMCESLGFDPVTNCEVKTEQRRLGTTKASPERIQIHCCLHKTKTNNKKVYICDF